MGHRGRRKRRRRRRRRGRPKSLGGNWSGLS
jgi:hypothetical protein